MLPHPPKYILSNILVPPPHHLANIRNKNNACPPGFRVKEDCGWFSDTITCEPPTSFSPNAVPVSARYNMNGPCTKDPTDPAQGGTVPQDVTTCESNGDVTVETRYSRCCAFGLGACDVTGWHQAITCAEGQGDLVFDARSHRSCVDKQNGLSNNFAAQSWCKDANSRGEAQG